MVIEKNEKVVSVYKQLIDWYILGLVLEGQSDD